MARHEIEARRALQILKFSSNSEVLKPYEVRRTFWNLKPGGGERVQGVGGGRPMVGFQKSDDLSMIYRHLRHF